MSDDTSTGEPRKMLSLKEVLKLVPYSERTILRMQSQERFPRSHPLVRGVGKNGRRFWFADEIVRWQKTLEDT